MSKCLDHKLQLLPRLACNLYNPFILVYVCHVGTYLSVSCIWLPLNSGWISHLWLSLSSNLSTGIPNLFFLPFANSPSGFYWESMLPLRKDCLSTVSDWANHLYPCMTSCGRKMYPSSTWGRSIHSWNRLDLLYLFSSLMYFVNCFGLLSEGP